MGTFDQPGAGALVSRVELSVPLFGFVTPATSIMTTTSTLAEVNPEPPNPLALTP